MTKTEVNKFKQVLEAKKAELADVLKRRDEIAIEKSPDAIDEVTRAAERELAIRNLDRESNLMTSTKPRQPSKGC
jgi:DnaK suppressor protein